LLFNPLSTLPLEWLRN